MHLHNEYVTLMRTQTELFRNSEKWNGMNEKTNPEMMSWLVLIKLDCHKVSTINPNPAYGLIGSVSFFANNRPFIR